MLEVRKLSFTRQRKHLFQKLDKQFAVGKVTYIVGANGVGKTTLLKVLAGLLTPDEGTVYCAGEAIQNDLEQYSKKMVFIGHNAAINDVLTVSENLAFFAVCYRAEAPDYKRLLKSVELWQHRDKAAYQLSAGQRRKLSLLRLKLSRSPIWLLDEPFTSLDAETVALLESWITRHANAGGSVVMTSHQTPDFDEEILDVFELGTRFAA